MLPNDRVALFMPNSIEWIVLYYAIVRSGGVVVCISSFYKKEEVAELIEESKASLLITSEELQEHVPDMKDLPIVEDIMVLDKDPSFAEIFSLKKRLQSSTTSIVDCRPDSVCVILFTGGTTGLPKGVMLTHSNILYSSQNVCYHEKITPEDISICFLPLNHVFAGIHIMNSTFFGGGTLVLHKNFDFDQVIASIKKKRVSRLYAVPTVYIRLLDSLQNSEDLASIRYCFSAATSMAPEVVRQWNEKFQLKIHEAYGMTETASLVTYNHLHKHKIGTVGTPAGLVEVKTVDASGMEVSIGEVGEIVVRGPNVMKGYFNRPEETAAVIKNGWLHSGDIGRFDDEGHLTIIDRLKEMIISGGLNVYPKEVEDVLYTHPAVKECAVFGTPDREYGETVTACLVTIAERQIDASDIKRFCKEHIASYKVPKKIIFVENLPKSSAGKILKRVIRNDFMSS